MKIKEFLKGFKGDFKGILKRFPQGVVVCLAFTLMLILDRAKGGGYGIPFAEEYYVRLAMVLSLGLPITVGINQYFHSRDKKLGKRGMLCYLIGAVFLGVYYSFLLKVESNETMIRFFVTTAVLWIGAISIPHIGNEKKLSFHISKIFTRFWVTIMYSGIIYLGITAITRTIEFLFKVDISYNVLYYIGVCIFGIFSTLYFIGGIPKHQEEMEEKDYSKILKILMVYIIIPILTIYIGILYAYVVKMVIVWSWPEIMISHLVLWCSLVIILTIILITPLKEENKIAGLFYKIAPIGMMPLVILMIVAMGVRINAYGFTNKRYLVMAGALWVVISFVKFIIKKEKNDIIVTLSLVAILTLSVYGPVSAFNVDVRSQNNRFEKILEKYNKVEDGIMVKNENEIDDQDKESLKSIINHFRREYSIEEIKVLPEGFNSEVAEEYLGFTYYEYDPSVIQNRINMSFNVESSTKAIDIKGYDYLIENTYYNDNMDEDSQYYSWIKDNRIEIYKKSADSNKDEMVLSYDFEEDFIKLFKEDEENPNKYNMDRDKLIFVQENEGYKAKIILERFYGTYYKNKDVLEEGNGSYKVLIKEK